MDILTVLEQVVLTAIIVLKGEAYGVSLSRKTRELSGKTIMYGSLYNLLDQLHKKGYVTKRLKTPSPDEGGHERILYTVTPAGLKALKEAQSLQTVLWDSLPAYARKN
ncbi:MAG: PadR family transcriptional regulator [Candidatus Aminicenantes bacterium]|nr:PadR family transcriptional regulator [Candidatus Aminicenantes bacterium]